MPKLLAVLFLSLVLTGGCDSCGSPATERPGVRFSKEAEKAAALPWQPWSPAVLDEAKRTDKPVLISITDPLCFWCEVFDRSTLANERVIEILQDKFVLVRVEKERQPHVAARLESGLPAVAALDRQGAQVWFANFLQPTAFNQGLYKVLRDEMLTILPAGKTRYATRPGTPSGETLTELSVGYQSNFDFARKGYAGAAKTLALAEMRYDLKVGEALNDSHARIRLLMQLDSAMANLRDPQGGFVTGTFRETWKPVNPIKYAHEQAEMAALVATLGASQWRTLAPRYEEYVKAAEEAVRWLESNLVRGGSLIPGELGTAESFSGGPKAPKPPFSPMASTDIGGATAAALAEAGRISGKDGWIELAGKIAGTFLEARTPQGLFWHVPEWKAAPNELADAAAMLDATVALYQATGEEKWLAAAQEIALALEQLSSPAGYFVDTTAGADAVFPPEPVPAANLRAAAALWRLGCIADAFPYRERAKRVVGAFAGDPRMLERSAGDFGVLVYQMTGPGGVLALPTAWRNQPDATWLIRNAQASYYYRWTDQPKAQLCEDRHCSKEFATPAEAEAAVRQYLKTMKIP